MKTKQKSQATHICTQRLIEIHTDTKRQKHKQTQKCKNETFKYNLYKTNSILIVRFDCLSTISKIYKTHSDVKNINE